MELFGLVLALQAEMGWGWGRVFETGNILNKERLREYNKEVSVCKKALGTYWNEGFEKLLS
jgi:hypothetical protein